MKRLVIFLTMLLCLASPAAAFAYNPLQTACSGNGGNSAACHGANDPITGPHGALRKASLLIAMFAGIAAIIIIIIAGMYYITSEGDPQKAANARSTLIGAVIGLVIIAGAEGILTFVLSKL